MKNWVIQHRKLKRMIQYYVNMSLETLPTTVKVNVKQFLNDTDLTKIRMVSKKCKDFF